MPAAAAPPLSVSRTAITTRAPGARELARRLQPDAAVGSRHDERATVLTGGCRLPSTWPCEDPTWLVWHAPGVPTTPSAQYSLTIRVEIAHKPGMLGRVAGAIGEAGGVIGAVDLVEVERRRSSCATSPSTPRTRRTGTRSSRAIDGARRRAGRRHDRPHVPAARRRQDRACTTSRRCARATTSRWPTRPGVARVCTRSREDRDKAFQYTIKRNTVAVVSDGTAVLGLGDIGPEAAMPVMEGKAMLFKEFAGVDAFPICLDTKDPDEIVETVRRIAPAFGGHQPRGHQRAALLRDRGPAEGRAGHPGLPRRPARHRGRRAGRADQRLPADRPRARRTCACSSPGWAPPASRSAKILMEAGVRHVVGARLAGAWSPPSGPTTSTAR